MFKALAGDVLQANQKQFLESRKQKEEAEERIRAMRKNKLFRRIQADLKERDKKRKPGE